MTRFMQLPADTQKLVAGLAAAALIVMGGALSWTLHGQVASARSRLEASATNRQAMMELVRDFEARQLSGAATDLSALVTRSLQGKSFQPALIQQQNGELALRFDNAPFADVLAWMIELEDAGAIVANVVVAQAQSGVSLSLVLRGA